VVKALRRAGTGASSRRQRRALELLASSQHGANVRRKLAAAEREVAMSGGKTIEVVRIRITAAGRKAIGGDRAQFCAGDNTSLGLTGR
jgi:hypothetical protein